jgi:hypothetical protein
MDGRQQRDHHTAARRDRFYGNTTDAELSFVRGADDRVTALERRAGGSRRTGRRGASMADARNATAIGAARAPATDVRRK